MNPKAFKAYKSHINDNIKPTDTLEGGRMKVKVFCANLFQFVCFFFIYNILISGSINIFYTRIYYFKILL